LSPLYKFCERTYEVSKKAFQHCTILDTAEEGAKKTKLAKTGDENDVFCVLHLVLVAFYHFLPPALEADEEAK
jgi:hypothetical protein